MTDLFLSTLNMVENDHHLIWTLISPQSLPDSAINTDYHFGRLVKMLNDLTSRKHSWARKSDQYFK